MSFFSKSSNGHHYKNGNNGYNHYRQNGMLGNLFNAIFSGSHSKGYPNPNQPPYTSPPSYPNQQMVPNQQLQTNYPIQNQQIWQQNNLVCSKCNSKIPAGSKFCLECGEKVNDTLFCTNCKEKLPTNAKFCLNCGSKV